MAAKSHLRNARPVLLAVSTNDALAGAAENIGKLLGRKNYYFVPFRQDSWENKPTSLVADFSLIPNAAEKAINGSNCSPFFWPEIHSLTTGSGQEPGGIVLYRKVCKKMQGF